MSELPRNLRARVDASVAALRSALAEFKNVCYANSLGAESVVLTASVLAGLAPRAGPAGLEDLDGDAVGEPGVALAGRGLLDTTRLASSPAEIWRDIAATNAYEIGAALGALIAVLESLRGDLQAGDKLDDVFAAADRWREHLKGPQATEGG